MNKNTSLSKQAIILMIGKGGGLIISFFVPIIIVRLTNPYEFGTYKLFFLIFSTLFFIEQMGMTQSIYYFVPGNVRKGVYITQSFFYLLLIGLMSAIFVYYFSMEIGAFLNNPDITRYIPIVGLFLLFRLGASIFEILLIAEMKVKFASLIIFITELFRLIFMVVPFFLIGTLYSLFIGAVCFAMIRFIFTVIYIRKYLTFSIREINVDSLREHFSYSLPLGFAMILFVISLNLNNYFVAYIFPPEIFAIFAVGIFYPPIIEVIESPIVEPMFVKIVKYVKVGNAGGIYEVWFNSIRKLSLAFFPILAFSLVEAKQIISVLFTENYLASVPIFMVTIMRIFFAVFIPDNVIKAHGKTKFILKVNIFTLIIYAIVLFSLIKIIGLVGAAVAMIFNEMVTKIILTNKARSLLKLPVISFLPWMHLVSCLTISLISALPVYIYNSLLPEYSFLNICISFIIFLITYVYIVSKSSLLRDNEKDAILAYFRRKVLFSEDPG